MKKDLGYYHNLFLSYLTHEKGSSKNTMDGYQSDFRNFSAFLRMKETPMVLSAMKPGVFKDYIDFLYDSGYKKASVRRKINSAKSFFNFLVLYDFILTHPLKAIESPKRGKNAPISFSEKQVVHLLKTAKELRYSTSFRNYILIKLIAETGICRQEAVDLNFEDIDYRNNLVQIPGKKGRVRQIPIKQELSDELLMYRQSRLPLTNQAVFVTSTGNRIHATMCQTIFKTLLKSADLDEQGFSLKNLRNSYATMLVSKGVHLESVQKLLGHQCMSSTSRYAHSSIQSLREAANVLPY